MQLLQDIWFFIKSLTFVDYVFFFAIIVLLVLIVTLVYFIKLNKESLKPIEGIDSDLLEITKELEKVEEKPRIEFTDYEKDQEEKAIISYDELLKKGKVSSINYDDEKDLDGLSIKKINLDNVVDDTNKINEKKNEFSCRIISYKQEEEFLTALKQLNNLLN